MLGQRRDEDEDGLGESHDEKGAVLQAKFSPAVVLFGQLANSDRMANSEQSEQCHWHDAQPSALPVPITKGLVLAVGARQPEATRAEETTSAEPYGIS